MLCRYAKALSQFQALAAATTPGGPDYRYTTGDDTLRVFTRDDNTKQVMVSLKRVVCVPATLDPRPHPER